MSNEKSKRPVGRPRADGRAHITREDVFKAATRLIAQRGYAGTSLRMIAEKLGVQAPSILNLFKTKDRILIDLVVHLSRYSLNFYQALEEQGLASEVMIYKMVYEECRVLSIEKNREITSIFYLPELRQPHFKEAQSQRAQMISHYKKQLDKGIGEGIFRALNSAMSAEQIFQLTETNLIALHTDSFGSPEQQARETACFVMRGILAKPEQLDNIAQRAKDCDFELISS
ncbi:MAG: TetR/AcrR family transcriptional regulator [Pseudomonadales bacterium]|nr:TetR/AcrR family transcriptional regulator [Pseudomonadales bacterium]